LYDWKVDPWQIKNLASDPNFHSTLEQHRARLDRWIVDSHDQGYEAEAMYDSDMVAYLGKGNPEVEKNIESTKQGAKFKSADGKKP
jgi:hypothetical protein